MNPKDAAAHNMVVGMDALFLVDRLARETPLSGEERLAKRKERSEEHTSELQSR